MARKTVNERLRESLALVTEKLSESDSLLREYQIAVAVLLNKAGGSVTVSEGDVATAISCDVSVTKDGDGLKWECLVTNDAGSGT